MIEAQHYEKLNRDQIRCHLCPHRCTIADGQRGLCTVRENRGGILYSLNYGKVTGLSADPVEKKPLRHFMSGTRTLSAGSFGCNLFCPYCQNHHISRATSGGHDMDAMQFINLAIKHDCPSVALTYNEPFVFYEWTLDVAMLAQSKGLAVILVTNGYVNPDPLKELLPYVNAMNIDLKSFDANLHKKFTGGDLSSVLQTIKTVATSPCHLELTTLMVPGLSDDLDTLEQQCKWIVGIDPHIPLHLSRYFPRHKYQEAPTDPELILKACNLARKYLTTVYPGNL